MESLESINLPQEQIEWSIDKVRLQFDSDAVWVCGVQINWIFHWITEENLAFPYLTNENLTQFTDWWKHTTRGYLASKLSKQALKVIA